MYAGSQIGKLSIKHNNYNPMLTFIGTVIGNSLSGAIIQVTGSWANVFYVSGILGTVWVILFLMLCYGDPASHPFITEKEKLYLGEEIGKIFNVVRS